MNYTNILRNRISLNDYMSSNEYKNSVAYHIVYNMNYKTGHIYTDNYYNGSRRKYIFLDKLGNQYLFLPILLVIKYIPIYYSISTGRYDHTSELYIDRVTNNKPVVFNKLLYPVNFDDVYVDLILNSSNNVLDKVKSDCWKSWWTFMCIREYCDMYLPNELIEIIFNYY
jgi:hypothetical protein